MMWDDEQWECSCGWANIFLRLKCRNCGKVLTTSDSVVSTSHTGDDTSYRLDDNAPQ
jgi:hypothetical protein